MYSRAKVCWTRKIATHSTFDYNMPYGIGNMNVFDKRICTKLNVTLRDSIEPDNIVDYWINIKTRFTKPEYLQFDWEANIDTMKFSIAKRH